MAEITTYYEAETWGGLQCEKTNPISELVL